MNRFILLVVLLFTSLGLAQKTENHKFRVLTLSGYEYNYLKSPDEVLFEGTVLGRDSLINSSVYQDIDLRYNFKTEGRYSTFSLVAAPEARFFYEQPEDSYWRFSLNLSYELELSKSWDYLAFARFKRNDREGLDGAQDILINPLGFTQYEAQTGVQYRPFRYNKMILLAGFRHKNFDAFGVRDLEYNQYELSFTSEQRFKVGRRFQKIGIELAARKRLYQTLNTTNEIPDGERDWDYLDATAFLELRLSKAFRITPAFNYYQRIDQLIDRSGFTQFGPRLGLRYSGDKLVLNASTAFNTRNYKTFDARDSSGLTGEKIKYEYVNLSFNATWQLNESLYIRAEVYSRVRSTNYTDITARSFRNYRNQYAGLGLQWRL
ncbi:hypothetical protein [Gilvibacter sediminis]|uniref:hypothetical protein n=1 Tax=Gilvibacter sediminis TaxID=379071 RepID=UPI002350AE06|nr:hypothetical protein [Gilvibacter sediminis]MDC7998122.1 hypothetical protein [Gilvibacter sediminis]